MFESIYKKRKNPIFNIAGWALLILVCLIFVFVGYSPEVDFIGSGSSVAHVNGETITYSDFNRYYERVQESRGQTKLNSAERQKLQNEVVDSLVNRSLILQSARKDGIIISAEEVRDFLMQIPQFQEDGKFSILKYKELVRGQGMSEARFEEKIIEDLLVQKMNSFYQKASADSEMIESQEDVVSKIKLNVQFVKKAKAELVSDAEITEADVQKFIKDNSSRIDKYYKEKSGTEFTQDESARAQHILIKITPEMPEDKALTKIKEIVAQLKPDNFDQLAKKFSEDPGSKDRGGDLGLFTRGKMVKEFEEQAFSLPVGQVSQPFKTSFGYHVLKVNQRVDKKTQPLDEVRASIARQLIKNDRTDAAVKVIKEALVGGPQSAQALLTQKGWAWDETGEFGLGDMMIPKIGNDDALLAAAMSLNPGDAIYKDVIQKDGFYYLIKLKSLNSKDGAKKDANADLFKQIFAQQKSYETFQAWMDHLRKGASIKINQKVLSQN